MAAGQPYLQSTIHVQYARSSHNRNEDLLIVKKRVKDKATGEERPYIDYVKNYKRPFWITKPGLRDHEQKRDWERTDNCDRYDCTDAELGFRIAKVLGGDAMQRPYLRAVTESPYVYGADVTAPVFYKFASMQAEKADNGNWVPDASIAVLDLETDVVEGHGRIFSGAVTYKDKALIVVDRRWAKPLATPEAQIKEACYKYLGKKIKERNIELKIVMVDNDLELVQRLFQFLHATKPDFACAYNMSFDLGKILECLSDYGVDPADIFCDPNLPAEYRSFTFTVDGKKRPGKEKEKKPTDGNKKKSHKKHPAELWHIVEAPASFQWLDPMAAFVQLRAVEQMRTSYTLDSMLLDHLGERKLKFVEADHVTGLAWHRFVSTKYKPEYCAYNLYDCIGVEELDECLTDLSRKILPYAGVSELKRVKNNPIRLTDAYFFHLFADGKVPCCAGSTMRTPLDAKLLSRRGWVVTLDNTLTLPCATTGLYGAYFRTDCRFSKSIWDIDITSGYPSSNVVGNISMGTNLAEPFTFLDRRDPTKKLRKAAVDLTNVPGNAMEIAQDTMNLQSLIAIGKAYRAKRAADGL